MGISDALLGRKNADGNPYIRFHRTGLFSAGGEVRIMGKALKPPKLTRPVVSFDGMAGSIVVSSEDFVIAAVPFGAHSGQVIVQANGHASNGREVKVAELIAENFHPVANPALIRKAIST